MTKNTARWPYGEDRTRELLTRERYAERPFLLRETGAQELPTWKGQLSSNEKSSRRARISSDDFQRGGDEFVDSLFDVF